MPSFSLGLTQLSESDKDDDNVKEEEVQNDKDCGNNSSNHICDHLEAEAVAATTLHEQEQEKHDQMPSFGLGLTQMSESDKDDGNEKEEKWQNGKDCGHNSSDPISDNLKTEGVDTAPVHEQEQETEHDEESEQQDLENASKKMECANKKGKTHGMVCRDRSKMRKAKIFCSPYKKRPTSISNKLSKFEKQMALYAIYAQKNGDEKMFEFAHIVVEKGKFMSFAKEAFIHPDLVDAWTLILNNREESRAVGSPFRFFATIRPCYNTLVCPPKRVKVETRRKLFVEKLALDLENQNIEAAKIDLIFFPIYKLSEFFVICIDLRKGKLFVIDHKNDDESKCDADKYGDNLIDVKEAVMFYLVQQGLKEKARMLDDAKFSFVTMKWGDDSNSTDGGIYAMRHMETFMGDPVGEWKTGLTKKSGRQLKLLRVKYCSSITSWNKNTLNEKIVKEAECYYKECCEAKHFNDEKLFFD